MVGVIAKGFAKRIHRSERGVQAFELAERHYALETLLQIANEFNITISIEKRKK